MDHDQRLQIITAAVAAVGGAAGDDQAAWQARVDVMIARLTAMCAENSPAARLIEQVERSKTFTATIVGGKIETSSTRVVVKLKTRPSERNPEGVEEARTERTDTPAGREMSQRLRALKGHRVAIWVEIEQIPGSDRRVRVFATWRTSVSTPTSPGRTRTSHTRWRPPGDAGRTDGTPGRSRPSASRVASPQQERVMADITLAAEPDTTEDGWLPSGSVDGPDHAGLEGGDRSQAGPDHTTQSRQAADRARRTLVRKAVLRTVAIAALPKAKARLLATLLAVSDPTDVAAVAVAALEAGRAQREVVRRLSEIAGADAMDAGVLAVGLFEERSLFRSSWAVLAALGAEMPASPPAVQTKAGLALAKAAKNLDRAKLADLDALALLIG